jgi:hypothetical protein
MVPQLAARVGLVRMQSQAKDLYVTTKMLRLLGIRSEDVQWSVLDIRFFIFSLTNRGTALFIVNKPAT